MDKFETVYFWPDPVQCFREIYRVLKPNGTFLICNECSGTTQKEQQWTKKIANMVIYPGAQRKAFLEQAGFRDVQVHQQKSGWLCVTAHK